MTTPHLFPSLVDGPAQIVVIVGTGLSTPDAPTVDALKANLDQIAKSLGAPPNSDFYDLAEGVLDRLASSGKSDPDSRIWLAEKLGMLDDRKWFGEIGLPISGNTPRHRALARFAVERRIRAVISLNWDALLESALESIGLSEGRRPVRPWEITTHARVVEDAHLPSLAAAHVFPVIKPHGCVRNLESARRNLSATGIGEPVIFKLTKSELKEIAGGQGLVDKKVEGFVAECPLLALGWKATEPYLRNTVVSTAIATKRTDEDAFTLISRSWYPNTKVPAETYHDEISAAYGKQKGDSFLPVGNNGDPTMDCVLKWLYCRYSITRVAASASPGAKVGVQQILRDLAKPDFQHVVTAWADYWLPTWVRLCWRAGVVAGIDPYTNNKIESWEIPITPRDIHLPLGGMAVERTDLRAAANLLFGLRDELSRFDFERFPGGILEQGTRSLYLILPGWRGASGNVDLAALKPHLDSFSGWGFIETVKLVTISADGMDADAPLCHQLEAQIRGLLPLSKFATVGALQWVTLDAMKGGAHVVVD